MLRATLCQLRTFLTRFENIQLSNEECESLAVAAVSGHAEAEFMVGTVYDAAGEPACAMEWYRRAAMRDYVPALLQMFAIR
ncbi:MAG: hypothetical protein P4M01_04660 [Acidobacteriota bacterium]|nr:hypothetical protein [Acidobacteriota bacterium]